MSDHPHEPNSPAGPRPIIPLASSSQAGAILFVVILLMGGALLYRTLSAAQSPSEVPTVLAPDPGSVARIASPQRLQVPERFLIEETLGRNEEPPRQEPLTPPVIETPIAIAPPIASVPEFVPPSPPLSLPEDVPAQNDEPRVVFEAAPRPDPVSLRSEGGPIEEDRVSAGRLRNPSFTIPQGTVIPAVLETALDSTRPGGVRALVQRDVSGFDGSRVLIPRGSRLYGEYEANLQPGQNRAMVQWTRLIRPDGVTIALDSPSSDPLGRAGIRGRVDSKFLQRFGGALLQSFLDIGVGLAVSEATDGVIVALPGSTQNVQVQQPQQIQPTLRVRHGASVSVFVARDLDFSSVDQ